MSSVLLQVGETLGGLRVSKSVEDLTVRLLIVPNLMNTGYTDVFRQAGFLYLDSLLESGEAATVFRRLRISCALDPGMRVVYDVVRKSYLEAILPRVLVNQRGVVVVGTHPSDVDLLNFSTVELLSVSEPGMFELSCAVYGEPVMLSTEYSHVCAVVEDSVDTYVELDRWSSLSAVLSRNYMLHDTTYGEVGVGVQRRFLTDILQRHAPRPQFWMEQIVEDLTDESSMGFILHYDYLRCVLPAYRDAVYKLLAQAPSIRYFVMLPWYVVDSRVVMLTCYRTNSDGELAVSMRGQSLVDFVTRRFRNHVAAPELVGTWIGALLCDPLTASETAKQLTGKALLPESEDSFELGYRERSVDELSLSKEIGAKTWKVPREVAWMYDACPNVMAYAWSGEYDTDGIIVTGPEIGGDWASTIRIAHMLRNYGDTAEQRCEVRAFIRRLHSLGVTAPGFLPRVEHVLRKAVSDPGTLVQRDELLLQLPGCGYLRSYTREVRIAVFLELGFFPTLGDCIIGDARGVAVTTPAAELTLWHMALRNAVLSGSTRDKMGCRDYIVGADDRSPGFCYLVLFRPVNREAAKQQLGAYPPLINVLNLPVEWRVKGYEDSVYVSIISSSEHDKMLHFSRDGGMPWAMFMGNMVSLSGPSVLQQPVGDDTGQCLGQEWKTGLIISATVNAMLLIGSLVWLWLRLRGTRTSFARSGYR